MSRPFLHAQWRKLVLINYIIDPKVLSSFIPAHTELDMWEGACYISLVGFMFQDTRIKGIRIPFHSEFEEVNLRFYVRHQEGREWKRGVVFIKEIVPKRALSLVANMVYDENYETMPMRHQWHADDTSLTVEYAWKKRNWNTIRVVASNISVKMQEGSEEEFITEHYWGYTRISDLRTSEYHVEHPRWDIYPVRHSMVDVDFRQIYGAGFDILQNEKPASVILAEGSEVIVREKKIL